MPGQRIGSLPLKHREYGAAEMSNVPIPYVRGSGTPGTLTVTGFPVDAIDGIPIVVQIDGDGDGSVGSSTFLWKYGGTEQGSGLTTSDTYSLSNSSVTTGLVLNFPDAGMNSGHSWYFTPQKIDLLAVSPSNIDGSHYGATQLTCKGGSGTIKVDMQGGNDVELTLSNAEKISGEFLRITSVSNTITNLRVSW